MSSSDHQDASGQPAEPSIIQISREFSSEKLADMQKCLSNTNAFKLNTLHVVVGNESCDLDSAVSSLVMYHIISRTADQMIGKDQTKTLYLPVLNTTRNMLDSKSEVLWYIQKTLQVEKSFLFCKDDIDWVAMKKNNIEILVTLVDHNYNEEFASYGTIVEIIDHHQIQNYQWLMEHPKVRLTIDPAVGSCSTLIGERLLYSYDQHRCSNEIMQLVYGTIILDTICLSEKAKRFTKRDVYLLKKFDDILGPKRPARDQLYRQIVEVKNSTREMNFEKLMVRDLKVYKDRNGLRVGIASLFGMLAREALGLAANVDMDQFFRNNQYEAFVIMGLVADIEQSDSISRDIVLISANKQLYKSLRQAFEEDVDNLDLESIAKDGSQDLEDSLILNTGPPDLSESPDGTVYKAKIWIQRNVTSSRKVLAPLVLKVLNDNAI